MDSEISPQLKTLFIAKVEELKSLKNSSPPKQSFFPENSVVLSQEDKDKESDRGLREKYAKWIIIGIGVEIFLSYVLVVIVGSGWLKLEQWLVALLFESTLIQSFAAFKEILKYLFYRNK